MTIHYVDYSRQKAPDIRNEPKIRGILDILDHGNGISADVPPRPPRRWSVSGGGWPLLTVALVLIVLVVGGLRPLSGQPTQAPTAAPNTPVTYAKQPAAGASASVTLPDVVGKNAKTGSQQLQQLGLTNVELSSVNPRYRMVIVASNWTVVSTNPPPRAVVNPNDQVVLNVTKPSGTLRVPPVPIWSTSPTL
jgi:PASTA domain